MVLRRAAAWSLTVAASLLMVACASSGAAAPSPEVTGEPTLEPAAEYGGSTTMAQEGHGTPRYRIVFLGDSYTVGVGTDAPRRDSWPAQLTAALNQRGDLRVQSYNLAQESHPSIQVLDEQVDGVAGYEPDVVTLQVGLNDIVSHDDAYRGNIAAILDRLLLTLDPEHIFVITTPDHTLTEWGRQRGSSAAVAALNASLIEEAEARDITVIDIGPVNERVAVDGSLLVQSDPPEPYPTAKQYAGWAEVIGPYVYDALKSIDP
jgi:lysophospholipase L1-like esterase